MVVSTHKSKQINKKFKSKKVEYIPEMQMKRGKFGVKKSERNRFSIKMRELVF